MPCGVGWGGGCPAWGRGCAEGGAAGGCFPQVANEEQICQLAKRNIVASGCLLTTLTFSSTSGLRQYLEAITANQSVKSPCSSSLPLGMVRSEATKLLLQTLPALLIRNLFSTILSSDQSPAAQPFGREAPAPTLRCHAWGAGALPSAPQAEPPADPRAPPQQCAG